MKNKEFLWNILVSFIIAIPLFLIFVDMYSGCLDCAKQPTVWEVISTSDPIMPLTTFAVVWVLIYIITLVIWLITILIIKKLKK